MPHRQSVYQNNVASNIIGNSFSIVGSVTNKPTQPLLIASNEFNQLNGADVLTFGAGENLSVISNDFYGPASSGVVFTGAGLQPSDGFVHRHAATS